ncbi:hypothetical protein ACMFY5_26270, partial [Pseudomonas sihuiensis]
APRVSTGEAMADLERIAAELPDGIGYEWIGLSYQERVATGPAVKLLPQANTGVLRLQVDHNESLAKPLIEMIIEPGGAN